MRIFNLIITALLTAMMCFTPVYAEDATDKSLSEQAVLDITDSDIPLADASDFEKMDITVTGLNGGQRIMLGKNGMLVIAEEGNPKLFVNGEEKECSKAPEMINGELYVPIEILDYFGLKAECKDGKAQIKLLSDVEKQLINMEMKDGMYLSDELLQNPSFENDFMLYGGWSNRSGSSVRQTQEQVVDGGFSGMVTNRTMGWSSISQDVTAEMAEYGRGKYLISGYVRTKDEPCQMTIKLLLQNTENKQSSFPLVDEVNNEGWTYFEGVKDVQWEYDLSSVLYYAEATSNTGKTSEVQDYYVDKCSLRKLMTREECIEYLTKKLDEEKTENEQKRLYEEHCKALSEKYSDEKLVTVYPEEDRKILKNPYKGLMMYPYYTNEFTGDRSIGAGPVSGVMYMRYSWDRIEPQENVFNWDMIDKNIEYCKKYGMQMGLGLGSTINYNSTTNYHQDTPEWVFEAGAAYTVDDMGDGCILKVPVYEDKVFREKMQHMIDEFAKRYNGNENIAFVDMRNYGNWGEWHFYRLPVNRKIAAERTQKQLFELIDMWKNVDLPLLSFVARSDVSDYAYKTLGAGIRGDGIMNPDLLNEHRRFANVKNKAMAVGEWFANDANVFLPGGKYEKYFGYMPTFYERIVTEGQTSIIAVANWLPDEAYEIWPDLYNRMANLVGYWYKPVKIEHSENLESGIIKIKMKNDGVAPLFAGREKKACVKLALADDDNNILDTAVLDGIDPINWHGGEYSDCVAEYNFQNGKKGTKLLLGVFTRESNEEPNVKLGIKADCINGWYDISSMRVSDLENPAHNKLYKSSQLYADDGYGFRRPEYAFDRDPETFWANNCINGNYLEIDFGEEKNITGMNVTVVDDIKENAAIQYYSGGRWRNIAEAYKFSKSGTEIRFGKVSTSKLRFVLKQTKNEVIKISEVTVF